VKQRGQPFQKGTYFSAIIFLGSNICLIKLYCMDTRLLLAIMDHKLRNVDRFLAICYMVLKAQNKISKQMLD
jgi:hypothetical protein